MVKLLDPPSNSQPGDRVNFEGYEHNKCGGKLFPIRGYALFSFRNQASCNRLNCTGGT